MPEQISFNKFLDIDLILETAQIEDKMRVADLGCGSSGHFVFPTSKLVGKNGIVYAVDILKPVLESIERRAKQENLSNIQIVWSNLEIFGAADIESSSIDIAMLNNTLYQSQKRVDILREAMRMLKKDSKLLVVDWESVSTPFGPPAEERVNKKNLKIACERLGMTLENEFEAGQYHFGLIFVK